VIAPSVHIPVSRIDGNLTTLAEYQGSLLLIVNVASACGLTPRYAALESVYEKVHAHGLEVLGFPCNDFARPRAGLERGNSAVLRDEVRDAVPGFREDCTQVARAPASYSHLITAQPKAQFTPDTTMQPARVLRCWSEHDSDVLRNFEKFLVDRSGAVVGRFAPDTPPDYPTIVAAIEAQIRQR
jgi:glutathione peroxidase